VARRAHIVVAGICRSLDAEEARRIRDEIDRQLEEEYAPTPDNLRLAMRRVLREQEERTHHD
jgi:vacuolar-type H+-ATPase subunit E/Vma4